jgi:hypothetical protein
MVAQQKTRDYAPATSTARPAYREARKVTLRSILIDELGDVTLQRAITAIFDVLANSLLTGVYHSTLYA